MRETIFKRIFHSRCVGTIPCFSPYYKGNQHSCLPVCFSGDEILQIRGSIRSCMSKFLVDRDKFPRSHMFFMQTVKILSKLQICAGWAEFCCCHMMTLDTTYPVVACLYKKVSKRYRLRGQRSFKDRYDFSL